MKDADTLTYPSLEKMARIFRPGIPALSIEWNKYTFRKYLQIQEQGRKTGNQIQAQAHVAGLVEKFHAQTWETNT